MRCPAAIPAIALGAGICAGIFISPAVNPLVPVLFLLTAIAVFATRRERATVLLTVCGFVSAGLVLGGHADAESRRQALRAVFDHHVPPGEFHLFTTVEGRLRTDASKGPSGVTLDVLVDRIEVDGSMREASGGVLIGVGGELTSDSLQAWRAGRRLALPASLRAPTKYLNRGVGDAERQLAWRGVALVGSVKSDRLVEIVSLGTPVSEALA